MKLIKPSFEILEQTPGIQGVKKQIELAGRTCYKSEDKITDTSCEEFVSRMVNSGHGAMLEHGTVYLFIKVSAYNQSLIYHIQEYEKNPYSKVLYLGTDDNEETEFKDVLGNPATGDMQYVITTNYRVLVENGWLDDLQYQCEPTEYHEKRITVKFICDRGVSHEFVRHRTMSFAQESTRYCNYSKDKFGNEITCILPSWELEGAYLEFEEDLKVIESIYFKWINKGWKAQEARYFLPTGVKTELVVTGFVSDWKYFFKLRCHSTAHPQARELAIPLQEEFVKKGYING
jgi:thymidylate synthase (FAD)